MACGDLQVAEQVRVDALRALENAAWSTVPLTLEPTHLKSRASMRF
jgi:hypothetical protein